MASGTMSIATDFKERILELPPNLIMSTREVQQKIKSFFGGATSLEIYHVLKELHQQKLIFKCKPKRTYLQWMIRDKENECLDFIFTNTEKGNYNFELGKCYKLNKSIFDLKVCESCEEKR